MRSSDGRLSAAQVFAALNEIRPKNTVLVEESPSNLSDLHKAWPITEPDTFYTFASGGLGWNLPASVTRSSWPFHSRTSSAPTFKTKPSRV
jgi:benzoylformate decarboxylase